MGRKKEKIILKRDKKLSRFIYVKLADIDNTGKVVVEYVYDSWDNYAIGGKVGAIIGFTVGLAIGLISEIEINGKSIIDHIRDGVYNFWKWLFG